MWTFIAARWRSCRLAYVATERSRPLPRKPSADADPLIWTPITVNHLKRHRKRQIADQLEAGPTWMETDLVFTRLDGVPLDPDIVSPTFNRIVKDTGLRRIRFHDLRQT